MRRAAALLLLALMALARAAAAEAPVPVTLGYLGLADDPRHRPVRLYTGVELRPEIRPVLGAELAVRDARVVGRALGVAFALEQALVAGPGEAAAAARRLAAEKGVRFLLVDLPAPLLATLARTEAAQGLVLLNVSATEDSLRGELCAPGLFHTIPSRAMLADALAQYAALMQWRRVLVVAGPEPDDAALAEGYARAVQRFGGKVVETRRFVSTRDPRQREQNNIRLLTQGVDYDAVLVADGTGELGRLFPYQTVLPRPVIGSVGLVPSAWHWAYERSGAPQLNQRFQRLTGDVRPMGDEPFAAWAAVRAVVEVYSRTRSTDFAVLRQALLDEGTAFDVYKDQRASFRPWDHQLRQPVLLHTADAVIATAPVDRFLHERNQLDTLGVDRPQTACRF
jgi:ABC transporter substrate binding protein (PQQ-dependent alcohol dehydrogenase system)